MHGENQFGNNFTQYDSFCRFQLGITIYLRISKTGTPSLLKKDHRSKRPVPPPRTQKIAGRLIWNIQHYYVDICIFWLFSNIVTLLARQQVTRSYNPVRSSAIFSVYNSIQYLMHSVKFKYCYIKLFDIIWT